MRVDKLAKDRFRLDLNQREARAVISALTIHRQELADAVAKARLEARPTKLIDEMTFDESVIRRSRDALASVACDDGYVDFIEAVAKDLRK